MKQHLPNGSYTAIYIIVLAKQEDTTVIASNLHQTNLIRMRGLPL